MKIKSLIGVLFLVAAMAATGGCGDSGASTTAAEEEAFKHPDKTKLPTPPAGGGMVEDKGKSSLDDGKAPVGVTPGNK